MEIRRGLAGFRHWKLAHRQRFFFVFKNKITTFVEVGKTIVASYCGNRDANEQGIMKERKRLWKGEVLSVRFVQNITEIPKKNINTMDGRCANTVTTR